MSKILILKELWDLIKVRKKWWLIPIIFFLVFFCSVLVLTEGSVLAPVIYTIF